MIPSFLLALTTVVIFCVSAALDPRKVRTGLYLLAALGGLTVLGLSALLTALSRYNTRSVDLAGWVLLAAFLLGALLVLGLTVLLIANGIVMLRRERARPAHALSAALGLALLGYIALAVLAVVRESTELVVLIFCIGLPSMYLGFSLTAFVLYGWLYGLWQRIRRRPVGAVIVLGAGLRNGNEVGPLLSARLDAGIAVYRRSIKRGRACVVVPSGGQGGDEDRPEGKAMAEYLYDHGIDRSVVSPEIRSRNTEENIEYSAAILRASHVGGPYAAATSNYHAFRAALLMRAYGIPGYTVGAKTAGYFWPSAILREYVAILMLHRWLNLTGLFLCCLPLLAYLVRLVF